MTDDSKTKKGKINPGKYFPSKFKPFATQAEALEQIGIFLNRPTESIMLLKMPPASGKSPLAAAAARAKVAEGDKAFILVPPGLESQYAKDLGDELAFARGAGQFSCVGGHGLCSGTAARRRCSHRKSGGCPWKEERKAAAENSGRVMVMTPSSFWFMRLNEREGGTIFPAKGGLLVIDEAHLLPRLLSSILEVRIDVGLVSGFVWPEFATVLQEKSGKMNRDDAGRPITEISKKNVEIFSALKEKVGIHLGRLTDLMLEMDLETLSEEFFFLGELTPDRLSAYEFYLKRVMDSITSLEKNIDGTQWAFDIAVKRPKDDYEFSPERESILRPAIPTQSFMLSKGCGDLRVRCAALPSGFMKDFLRGFDKIILMSGTLFRVHLERLGLISPGMIDEDGNIKGIRQFECQSRIPVSARRFYFDFSNGRHVNSQNIEENFRHFARVIIRKYVPRMRGVKGILHVHNRMQANMITVLLRLEISAIAKKFGASPDDICVVINEIEEKNFDVAMEKHKNHELKKHPKAGPQNLFLVAVKRYEGISLDDDLARMNIFLKCPLLNPFDVINKSLDNIYKNYITIETVTSIIQGKNRGTRHAKDYCLNVALDLATFNTMKKVIQELPESERESYEEVRDDEFIAEFKGRVR